MSSELEKAEKNYNELRIGVDQKLFEKISNWVSKNYDPVTKDIKKEELKEKLIEIIRDSSIVPIVNESEFNHENLLRAQQFLGSALKLKDKQTFIDLLGDEELISRHLFIYYYFF